MTAQILGQNPVWKLISFLFFLKKDLTASKPAVEPRGFEPMFEEKPKVVRTRTFGLPESEWNPTRSPVPIVRRSSQLESPSQIRNDRLAPYEQTKGPLKDQPAPWLDEEMALLHQLRTSNWRNG